MKDIPSGSVDMICTDLPYGMTACAFDTVIPFEPLWDAYKRIIKPNGAIVLFGSQPFTTDLIMSNRAWFKYEWIWEKTRPTGFVNANLKPMKSHENVLIFSPGMTANGSKNNMIYFPQGVVECNKPNNRGRRGEAGGERPNQVDSYLATRENYPRSILRFANEIGFHPTQKPVKLLEYLIRTYTNAGETVLDSCMGSGTTGVTCIQTGRNFIGIERDEHYFNLSSERIRHTSAGLFALPIEALI